jgi:O-antigen ligase
LRSASVPKARWNAAHNSFIQIGAELGVVGLLLFVAIIASAFVALRRSRPRDRDGVDPQDRRTQLSQVLTASLIGFVVGAVFLSLAYSEMLYTLVALAVGLRKVTSRAEPEGPEARPWPRPLSARSSAGTVYRRGIVGPSRPR